MSRREASRAVASVLGGALMVVAGLLILLVSRNYPEQQQALRGVALDLVPPVWSAARAPAEAVAAAATRIGEHFGTVERNRALAARVAKLESELAEHRTVLDENRRLRALLRVADVRRRAVAVARIAGGSAGSMLRSAVIGAGRAQGIDVGQPVLSTAGLIGRITEAGSGSARLMLVTDPESRVPVKIRRTGQPGMATGLNGTEIELQFLEPAQGLVRAGDELVTSGDGGIFAPDVPVGVITDVAGEAPRARPAASPNALSFVLVEQPYLPDLAEPARVAELGGTPAAGRPPVALATPGGLPAPVPVPGAPAPLAGRAPEPSPAVEP